MSDLDALRHVKTVDLRFQNDHSSESVVSYIEKCLLYVGILLEWCFVFRIFK